MVIKYVGESTQMLKCKCIKWSNAESNQLKYLGQAAKIRFPSMTKTPSSCRPPSGCRVSPNRSIAWIRRRQPKVPSQSDVACDNQNLGWHACVPCINAHDCTCVNIKLKYLLAGNGSELGMKSTPIDQVIECQHVLKCKYLLCFYSYINIHKTYAHVSIWTLLTKEFNRYWGCFWIHK